MIRTFGDNMRIRPLRYTDSPVIVGVVIKKSFIILHIINNKKIAIRASCPIIITTQFTIK
jgi:hypothetical protein